MVYEKENHRLTLGKKKPHRWDQHLKGIHPTNNRNYRKDANMSIPKDYLCINSKDTYPNENPLLEIQNGFLVGKTPDNVPISEIEALGHTNTPLSKVIRKKCLECCVSQQSEVKNCVATDCALWPYRMGKNPFQAARYKQTQAQTNNAEG